MTGELVAGVRAGGRSGFLRRIPAPAHRRTVRVVLWAAAVLGEAAVLAVLLLGGDQPVAPVQVVLQLVGGSFALCGLVAWRRRPDNRSGLLMTATGFAFYLTPLLAALDTALTQTLAVVVNDLWVLPFVALLLTYLTGGRLRTAADRVLVAAAAAAIAVLAPLGLVFVADPATLLLIHPDARLADAVETVQRGWFLALAVGTAAVLAGRWGTATGPGRRALRPSVAGAVVLLLFAALLVLDLLHVPRPSLLHWVAVCSIVTVPAAFLAGLLRSRLARGAVADLFRRPRDLRPEQLQAALARALRDPGLLIAYPQPGGGYADASGRPVDLPCGDGRVVAPVERGGVRLAVLVYDRALDEDPELIEAVGGAATVALENRRLQADAEARLAELEASRKRILAAGDAERRRIERNLHDGAQQRLVALALQLALVQRQIRSDPVGAEQLVTSASGELARSLEEIRELAHGIHPAVLDQGLRPALDTLATRCPIPAAVAYELVARLPEPLEFAAYCVACEAMANVAKHARASAVRLRVSSDGRTAVVEVADDGVGGADPNRGSGLRGLADRVEAFGGRLDVCSSPGGGTTVTAAIPLTAVARARGQP